MEGYQSAIRDFDVAPTDDQIPHLTPNPYTDSREARRRLTAHEVLEIRNALHFALADDPEEWSLQCEIMQVIVERILSRRPEREG